MADIAAQSTQVVGTTLTPVTPTASVGDWVPVGAYVTVRNASGSSINVTINIPGTDNYGSARPDPVVAVPAATAKRFGPMGADMGDPTHSGMVNIVCSSVTSVTLEVTY